MAKIKLTKNELKRQKDALKRYNRYLPTLVLKKQQLQVEIRKIQLAHQDLTRQQEARNQELDQWIAVFGEEIELADLLKISEIRSDTGNIAGVDIPIFVSIEFHVESYNLFTYPLWVDHAIDQLKKIFRLDIEIKILTEQIKRLSQELRITTQRVNLFEKVKIPESQENIRKIQIYLGDMQTSSVVCGKISKNKIQRVS